MHKAVNEKEDTRDDTMVTINENISLTRNQHQALKIVCDIYQQSFAEYIQHALVQTMKSEIKDDNLSIALLARLEGDGPTHQFCHTLPVPATPQTNTLGYPLFHKVTNVTNPDPIKMAWYRKLE